jgi:electron transfer flavoprotein alpha subunit
MYAGNALATVTASDKLKLMTVRPTAFDRAAAVRYKPLNTTVFLTCSNVFTCKLSIVAVVYQ